MDSAAFAVESSSFLSFHYMSALGQKQTSANGPVMSALPSKADMLGIGVQVGEVSNRFGALDHHPTINDPQVLPHFGADRPTPRNKARSSRYACDPLASEWSASQLHTRASELRKSFVMNAMKFGFLQVRRSL
jgi:hypothetical protein